MSSFNVVSSNVDHRLREGFTQFQKDANYVDMVIAADGCFKKVHRSIIALSSPYLAELMNALPSNYPVLYLYGVKHQMFTYLVQYIYSGHVEVPFEDMPEFLQIVKQLKIKGLENVQYTQNNRVTMNNEKQFVTKQEDKLADHVSNSGLMDIDRFIVNNKRIDALNCDNEVIELTAQETTYENDSMIDFEQAIEEHPLELPDTSSVLSNTKNILNSIKDYNFIQPSTSKQQTTCNLSMPQINLTADGSFSLGKIALEPEPPSNSCQMQIGKTKAQNNENVDYVVNEYEDHQYFISNTGSQVHLVLNGYTFYAHNTFVHKNKRRWRCSSYRREGCQASLDTEGNDITLRRNLHHNHTKTKKRKYQMLYDTFEDATAAIINTDAGLDIE